jgi:hypothetical protein
VRIVHWSWVVVVVTATSGIAMAHHSFAGRFDGSRALHLRGTVTSFEVASPHSRLYVDVRSDSGQVERWALESPSTLSLQRRGLERIVKPGDTIGVCGYAAKDGVDAGRAEGGVTRWLSAAVLTLAGGERLLWENYRQGKCGLDR